MEIMMIIMKLWLLSWVVSGISEMMSEVIDSNNLFLNLIKMAMGCSKCTTFWFVLLFTQQIYLAALVSFLMFLYSKINWLNETEL